MRQDTPLRGVMRGLLTLAACALFALFLNWAPTGLNGYQLRILNLNISRCGGAVACQDISPVPLTID